MAKTKLGHMACPDCAERVVVKINEHGTLSYSCHECDGSGYCKKDEARYPRWEAKITKLPGEQKQEKKTAPPPAEPAAPVKKKSGLFGDLNL